MDQYWIVDHGVGTFELFGPAHLASLAVVGLIATGLIRYGSEIPKARRVVMRRTFAALLALNEMSWHVWAASTDQYVIQRMLPLHLCSVMVWVSVIALLTNTRKLYPLLYFLGVAGGVQALITPDAESFGFPHFRFLQTMIAHGGVFLAGIYVVAVEDYRPSREIVWRLFVGLNVYAFFVAVVNSLIGSNYLFVSGKPESASLIDLMPEWPWYILILELLALLLLVALWLPFARDRRPGAVRS